MADITPDPAVAAPAPTQDAQASTPAASFDLAGARAAGASDSQIAAFLAPMHGFDLAAARNAGAPDTQIADFLAAQPAPPPPAPPPPESTATGAFVRAAGEQALPTVGGMAAAGPGATLGAALGAMVPVANATGVPEVIGAVGGGLLGYFGGSKAVESVQQAIIDKLPTSVQQAIGQSPEQRAADAKQHPYATMAGGLAPNLLMLRPGAIEQAAENAPAVAKFMSNPIAARVFGAGINTAMEAQQEGSAGQGYDPIKLGIAAAAGAMMNKETALGRSVSGAGANVAARLGGAMSLRPRPATINDAAADVLTATNVDDSISAAEDLAQRQSPIDVGQVAGTLDAGEPIEQGQAKLLRMFDSLGSGTVENDGSGGYRFRTPGPDGEDITHPIEAWDPDELRDETTPGGPIPADTAHAIADHYEAAGVKTVFYRDDPAMRFDGTYDPKQPDTIFVSNNPQRAAAQVAGHEFTHAIADTVLPDGTNLGDLLNQQIAASITPEGQRYAAATFGVTSPHRAGFPEGITGDTAHANAVQAHLVNELGADIGAEAPKFQTFLPKVVDAIQARFGNSVAGDVLTKLIGGLQHAVETVRGLFGDHTTESQNWVTNIGDIHDTLAKMYAERFGSPVERLQAQMDAVRDRSARDALVAGPQEAPEGVSEVEPSPSTPEDLTAKALTLRRWAGELSDEQKAATAASPQVGLLHQTEAAILRPVAGDETALAPPQAAQLEAVRSQIDAAARQPDSPALAAVKNEIGATQEALAAMPKAGELPTQEPGQTSAQFPVMTVHTPAGMRVEARPEVVELHSLIPSNLDDGRPNPNFPRSLQPRDRTNAASQAQIRSMAGNLVPDRLAPSPDAATGAPLVGPDGVVESGNGRILALRQVYGGEGTAAQAQAYHDWLTSKGFDVRGMDAPVLISRRTSALDNTVRQQLTLEANERPNLGMNAAEQARADVGRAAAAIDHWHGSDVGAASNRDFVRSFMASMSPEERGAMMMPDGSLSPDGARRIQNAVMAHAYGENMGPVLDKFLSGDSEGMKGVAGALSDTAGPWAKMRDAASRGEIPPDMDITKDLASAVETLARARQLGRPVSEILGQVDFDRPQISLNAETLLRAMFRDDALRQPAGRAAVTERLTKYATEALKASAGEDMFGTKPPTPRELLTLATKTAGKEAPERTLFSPRFPGDRPEAAAANAEDAPEIGRHDDDVSALIGAIHAERGEGSESPTVEGRDLSRIAQLGSKQVKNLNPLERSQSIFPRTLAALDTKFATYYRAFTARMTEGNVNAHTLRSTIGDSLVNLPAASRDRVYAAMELARKWDWRPDSANPDAVLRVRNNSYWQAQHSKVGDNYLLNSDETRAFHAAMKLGDEGWHMFMTALVRREGWQGPVDPVAIKAEASKNGLGLPEGKRLMRLANALEVAQQQGARAYFPAMRFGDIYLAVTPKVGPDLDTVSLAKGRPELQWFSTIERSTGRDLLGMNRVAPDQMPEMRDAIAKLGARTDNAGNPAFGEFKNTAPGVWESATHRLETGDLRRTPEILRSLNIPAIEKLFMMMERHATPEIIQQVMAERTPEGGLSSKDMNALKQQTARYGANYKLVGGEAFDKYQSLLGTAKDTLLDAMYHDLMAGWKKQAKLTPGYDADFDRAIGTHIGQVSRNAADMVHRSNVDTAFQDLQDNHPNRSVREYARDFQRYQDDPQSPLSHAAQSANQIGFAYALAANPASTLKIMLHAPMMGAPVMSVGVGMGKAAKEIALGTGEAYANIGFDTKTGAHINLDGLGKTPGEKAFIAQLDRANLLHSVGTDDIRRVNDRQAGLWGSSAPFMRRVMDIASSNISVADIANRSGIALAAYRIAQNKSALMLATKPLMEHNALFRAEVQHSIETQMTGQLGSDMQMADAQANALREVYPRFMLDQAAGQFGRMNQMPAARGTEGNLLFALHGFQTRYLSTMLQLMKNTGPEGKVAAAWMVGGLAAISGAYGLPFVQDVENGADWAWKAVTGVDPMVDSHLREWLNSTPFGKVGSEILLRGPGSLLTGINTPSAVGFGDTITRSMTPTDALGTIPSMLVGRLMTAYNRERTGQGAAAAGAELLPTALRNPAMAAIQADRGALSARGTMLMPADGITGADTIKRAIGFGPLDQAQAQARSEFAYDIGNHDSTARQDIERSYAVLALRASAADRNGDHDGAAALRTQATQMLQDNKDLMITQQGIRDAEFQLANPDLFRLTHTPMRVRAQVKNSPYQ